MIYLWIALGSAIGGILRHLLVTLIDKYLTTSLPWDILIVNITGSFVIGFLVTLLGVHGKLQLDYEIRQFLTVGICGGYTTFATFGLNTFTMIQNGKFTEAGLNVVLSVVLCILSIWSGYNVASFINNR